MRPIVAVKKVDAARTSSGWERNLLFFRFFSKNLFYLVEKTFCDWRCAIRVQTVEFLEQLFLFRGKLGRNLDEYTAELVSRPRTA